MMDNKKTRAVVTTSTSARRKEPLFRGFLWHALAIIAFILLSMLIKECSGPSSSSGYPDARPTNGFHTLPGGGYHIPSPDPGKIGPGRNPFQQVLQDRINVLLEKQNDGTADAFKAAFKALYPADDYRIVYFDPLTYRLQLQVPVAEKDHIMGTLNGEMSQFDFLLFEESVFGVSSIPNDPYLADSDVWHFSAIKAFDAWVITTGSDSVVVAVVDNCFDLKHPELKGKIVSPYNVPLRNRDLHPVLTARHPNHGTHVAALAVGNADNGKGSCGIAPGCRLMPVQVAGENGIMTMTAVLDGILYSIYQGADVVNVSLGVGVDSTVQYYPIQEQLRMIESGGHEQLRVWEKVLKIASDYHCTIVNSAGNENVLSGFNPICRSDQVIVVSAVDKQFRKSSFSNFGHYSDLPYDFSTLSAPGVDMLSAAIGNQYVWAQGTSQAAPIVTGAIALMKSLNRNLTTREVVTILQETGVESPDPIGNVIQLDLALKAVLDSSFRIPGKAPSNQFNSDPGKMKMGSVIADPASLYGLWKADRSFFSKESGTELDLFFRFSDVSNELLLAETNNAKDTYTAPLRVSVSNGGVQIAQLDNAKNASGDSYEVYEFSCSADREGYLLCEARAVNRTYSMSFYLEKIN